MTWGSVQAGTDALAAQFGDGKASLMPSSLTWHLGVGTAPSNVVEFSGNGYSAPTIANTTANMGTPAAAEMVPVVDIPFGTSTAAWSAAGSAVPNAIWSTDGSGNVRDFGTVAANPGVTDSGITVVAQANGGVTIQATVVT